MKYYVIAFWAFMGLSLYIFYTKHPTRSKDMLQYANTCIKYAPIDKDTKDFITPLFNFKQFGSDTSIQENKILNSGRKSNKRSVSETKKKYVAANQKWSCNHCQHLLDASYEIDHIVPLYQGGTNHRNQG